MFNDQSHSASLRGLRDKGPVKIIDFDRAFCLRTTQYVSFQHRYLDSILLRKLNRLRITRVCMSNDAHAGIGREHTLQSPGRFRCAIGHDDLPGMLTVADAYAAAMMEAHPRRTADRIDQCIQNRPIADGV